MCDRNLEWQAILKRDLDFIRSTLIDSHPGYHDELDDTVKSILANGWAEIDLLAGGVRNLDGYVAVLQRIVSLFGDPHLGLVNYWSRNSLEWAGVVPILRDDRMVIALEHVPSDFSLENIEIHAIDGERSMAWVENNILKFFASSPNGLRLDRAIATCFMDVGNPFISRARILTLGSGHEKFDLDLKWNKISRSYSEQILSKVLGSPSRAQGLEERSDQILWMRVPAFDDSILKLFQLLHDNPASFHGKQAFVLDLRGNGGGNSARATELLALLFGPEMLNEGGGSQIRWRATQGNARYLERFYENLPPDNADHKYLSEIVRQLLLAEQSGDLFFEEHDVPYDYASVPAHKRLADGLASFILIDGYCASACLNFLDSITFHRQRGAIDNVVILGRETSSDSPYNDIRIEKLPSDFGEIYFPMKRILYDGRRPYTAHHPDIEYRGLSQSPEAIEAWVLAEVHARLGDGSSIAASRQGAQDDDT